MRDPVMTPIKASDVTIGAVFHVMPEGIDKLPPDDQLDQKAKAAVLLMRLDPDDIKSARELDWGYQGIVAYSKICTHVGCPVGLYEQTTHHLLCPCHQSTFDVAHDCKVIFGPANRPLPQLPITVDAEGYLVAQHGFDKQWDRASGSADEHQSWSEGGRRSRRLGRRPDRHRQAGQDLHAQGLPRPLVVHARRDRDVQPDHPAAHRHVPDLLVRPVGRSRRLRRQLRADAWRLDVRGLQVHAGHLLRRPRWPADPADPPLVGPDLRGRDHGAHVPGLLHRRFPQAPRAQLGHRRHLAAALDARGLRRLLDPGRPALRHRAAHRLGLHGVDPGDRQLPDVLPVRWSVPGHGDHPAALHDPRVAAAGDHRGPVHRPHPDGDAAEAHPVPRPRPDQRQRRRIPLHAGLPGQGRRLLLHRLRRHRPAGRQSPPSTRSGPTDPTIHRRSRPAPSPTGTWASPRARCG